MDIEPDGVELRFKLGTFRLNIRGRKSSPFHECQIYLRMIISDINDIAPEGSSSAQSVSKRENGHVILLVIQLPNDQPVSSLTAGFEMRYLLLDSGVAS